MIVFACREKVRRIRFSTGNNGVFIMYTMPEIFPYFTNSEY
jgi:hypothetical protein